jgi:hypothetical protein
VAAQIRCAIYTRKSTEEGLSQEFNSLDAQREAGEAYIASQRHEGWAALSDRYDDGGFTGGNMERPALKRLLADIEAGRIDCVVVYKVDRLSRSLLASMITSSTFRSFSTRACPSPASACRIDHARDALRYLADGEQIRHEFWFGATLPTGMFNGRSSPEDTAKFKEIFFEGYLEMPETFVALMLATVSFQPDELNMTSGDVDFAPVDRRRKGPAARDRRREVRDDRAGVQDGCFFRAWARSPDYRASLRR